jgi:uncharacterized RDD family membrane protein YckC
MPPSPVFAAPAPPSYEPPPAPVYEPTPVVSPAYVAPAQPAPARSGWSKAPLFPRLMATIVDSIIMQPLVVPAVFWILADSARGAAPLGGIVLLAVGGLWMFVYAYIKDGLKGASLGKRVAGLMVVNLRDNRPAGVGASILRALVLNFISAIEAIIVLVDPKGQRLGDKVAKTQVVRMAEYEAAVPGWVRPGKGLAIALLVVTLLLGSVGGIVGGLAWAAAVSSGPDGAAFVTPTTTGSEPPQGEPTVDFTKPDEEVQAAAQVVTDFYSAINAADMEAIKATLAADLKSQVDPGAFEGWTKTTFEYTRGWIESEGETASIIGRESEQAYGAGDGGGVKFTLSRTTDGAWLISGWIAVDTTQVEGSDTSGSSAGIAGPLSSATARDIVTQILKARQTGSGNIIRRLATEKFLTASGDVWLDGMDNSEYFTKFKITAAKVNGTTAKVTVTESWVDGNQIATYTVIEQDGAVLVDVWSPQ